MRVLHVTPYFAPAFTYGGPPRSILGLCRGLRAAGVEVQVFTTTANGASELSATDGLYEDVAVRYFPRAFPRRFFGVSGLRKALTVECAQYDLMHIHGLWNLPAWMAARAAQRAVLPYVLSPRGMLEPGALALRPLRKRIGYQLAERRNLAHAALLHATGPAEAQRLADRHLGVEIVTLPNGVDLPQVPVQPNAFRRRLGLQEPSRQPLVTFLGRIHPIKRLDLLAAAFERVRVQQPHAQLVIAGPNEGEHRRAIEPCFAAIGAAVHWTGELDEAAKWALLADSDVLVLCSASENFGMSVAEALAAGTPVVVTRTCPWGDVERHVCGFWVDSVPGAIAAGIVKILESPTDAQRMGARGKMLVRDKYSWAAIGGTMAAHYARILGRHVLSAAAS